MRGGGGKKILKKCCTFFLEKLMRATKNIQLGTNFWKSLLGREINKKLDQFLKRLMRALKKQNTIKTLLEQLSFEIDMFFWKLANRCAGHKKPPVFWQ